MRHLGLPQDLGPVDEPSPSSVKATTSLGGPGSRRVTLAEVMTCTPCYDDVSWYAVSPSHLGLRRCTDRSGPSRLSRRSRREVSAASPCDGQDVDVLDTTVDEERSVPPS